jgi:hypothetical protein
VRQADDGASGIVREIEVLVGRRDPDLPGRDGPSRDLDALAFDREVAPDVVDPDVLIARPDVHPSLDPLPGDFRVISSDRGVRGGILDDDLPIAVIDPDLSAHTPGAHVGVFGRDPAGGSDALDIQRIEIIRAKASEVCLFSTRWEGFFG